EPLALLQLLEQLSSVDVGEHARDLLNELVLVDDLGGIGGEGRALDIGGKQSALPVEDVRPVHRGGDVVDAANSWLDRGKAQAHQPKRNGKEAQREGEARNAIAAAALGKIRTLGRRRRSTHMELAGQGPRPIPPEAKPSRAEE